MILDWLQYRGARLLLWLGEKFDRRLAPVGTEVDEYGFAR